MSRYAVVCAGDIQQETSGHWTCSFHCLKHLFNLKLYKFLRTNLRCREAGKALAVLSGFLRTNAHAISCPIPLSSLTLWFVCQLQINFVRGLKENKVLPSYERTHWEAAIGTQQDRAGLKVTAERSPQGVVNSWQLCLSSQLGCPSLLIIIINFVTSYVHLLCFLASSVLLLFNCTAEAGSLVGGSWAFQLSCDRSCSGSAPSPGSNWFISFQPAETGSTGENRSGWNRLRKSLSPDISCPLARAQ